MTLAAAPTAIPASPLSGSRSSITPFFRHRLRLFPLYRYIWPVIVVQAIKEAGMSEGPPAVNPVPSHLGTVTPRLVLSDGIGAIEFYVRAFGAEATGDFFAGPDGEVIHAEVKIGDSVVIIAQDAADGAPAVSPESVGGTVTAIMATYWEDVDAAWDRAVAAGAEVIFPLADHFYGERGGQLRDPYGQQWMMSQRIEDVSSEEMKRRATDL